MLITLALITVLAASCRTFTRTIESGIKYEEERHITKIVDAKVDMAVERAIDSRIAAVWDAYAPWVLALLTSGLAGSMGFKGIAAKLHKGVPPVKPADKHLA